MRRILLIKGKSQYDSTSVFMEELKSEFQNQGMLVDVLDSYQKEQYIQVRNSLQDTKYDMIFSINGMGLEKDSSLGKILLNENAIYCTMLMDHPLIHHERLKNTYTYSMVLSPDRNHVKYLERYYKNIWCEGFLAHGGCQAKKIIPYKERSIAVSFMGSYQNPEKVWEEFSKYPLEMRQLLEGCCRELLRHIDWDLEQAIRQQFEIRGIFCDDSQFADVSAEFWLVDRYVRSYYRDKVIRTIVEAGIPVDVYGDGWESMPLKETELLRKHGKVNFIESLEVVADSKISLNVMPWFKAGSHDRVFSAMLCESICFTDASSYLKEQCQDGENILFYKLEECEQIPDKLISILQNDKKGESIARKGKELALSKHTWAERAKEIIDYFLMVENAGV